MFMKVFLLTLLLLTSNCSENDEIIKKLKSFLQNNVDNEVILQFMEIFRKNKKQFPSHLTENTQAFKNHKNTIKANKGYI